MTGRVACGLACLALASWTVEARADEPVFDGPRELTMRTKEVAFETSFHHGTDGTNAPSFGGAIAAFYAPWLSVLGGATFTPAVFGTRQEYDTRGMMRLVFPEPLGGRFFVFAGAGGTVFFREDPATGAFGRAFGPVLGGGVFTNVGDGFRLRVEVRDHWLFPGRDGGARHEMFATLAAVLLVR